MKGAGLWSQWFGALLLALMLLAHTASAWANDRTVIVVLIDGFAPSMVEASDTLHLDRMAREGSFSHHLVPVFPTMSMSNHTSFATGCWPGNHGIMSNIFIDPERGRYDGSRDADWRTGCASMWEIAEGQGIASAALAITGAHSTKNGALATHTLPGLEWDDQPDDEARTKVAIDLLTMAGPERPALIALYLGGPDETAHWSGTATPQTRAAARAADRLVGQILSAIDALPKGREATLLVAADHGMVDVSPMINITKIMNKHRIRGQQASDGATAFIYLDDPATLGRAFARLSTYSEFDTFRQGEHADYSHLGGSARAGNLMIVTRPPYWIAGAEGFPLWSKLIGITRLWPDVFVPPGGSGLKATHGFLPSHPDMRAIFYAWGAGIRSGHEIETLDMIDIAPSALHLLGLPPSPGIDGQIVADMLDVTRATP